MYVQHLVALWRGRVTEHAKHCGLKGRRGNVIPLTTKVRAQLTRTRFGFVTLLSLAILSEMVKPETCEEETCKCTHRSDRSGWGGRASKEQKGNPGKSKRHCWRWILQHKDFGGINNFKVVELDDGTARSSDEVG